MNRGLSLIEAIMQSFDGGASIGASQPPNLLGSVIAIRGSQASVDITKPRTHHTDEPRVTVGKFLGISAGTCLLIGVVTNVALSAEAPTGGGERSTVAVLDIIGEIQDYASPSAHFRRGVTHYPAIGDLVSFVGSQELQLIYNISGPTVIEIGRLQQDNAIGAYVDANDMLSKHFAVLGTTGVGK